MIFHARLPQTGSQIVTKARFLCASGIGTKRFPSRAQFAESLSGKPFQSYLGPDVLVVEHADSGMIQELSEFSRDLMAATLEPNMLEESEVALRHFEKRELAWLEEPRDVSVVDQMNVPLVFEKGAVAVQENYLGTLNLEHQFVAGERAHILGLGLLVPWESAFLKDLENFGSRASGEFFHRIVEVRELAPTVKVAIVDRIIGRFYYWTIPTLVPHLVALHFLECLFRLESSQLEPQKIHSPWFQLPRETRKHGLLQCARLGVWPSNIKMDKFLAKEFCHPGWKP